MEEIKEEITKDSNEIWSDLIDRRQWDDASVVFIRLHENSERPLVVCHENRVRLMELSLHRPVEIPTEYFYLAIKGRALNVLLMILRGEIERNPDITDERALSTLDLLASGCTEMLNESLQASGRLIVFRRALEAGFPVEIFQRAGRQHEIKRFEIELDFDL